MKKKCLIFALIWILLSVLSACTSTYTPTPDENQTKLITLGTPFVTVNEDGIASWNAVVNAVKYAYVIDGGETKFTMQTSVQLTEGQSIQVKAIGDGVTYGESAMSIAATYAELSVDGWYVLENKTVDGIDATSQYVVNTLNLTESELTWYEIDISGSQTRSGTYSVAGNIVKIKIGIKTMEFSYSADTGILTFSGTVDRKQITYKFQKQQEDYEMSGDSGQVAFTQELFGDDIEQNYYNYCPTVMMEGRTMHIWYCSNMNSGEVVDHVAYRKGTLHDDGKWTFTEKQFVLEGTSGSWDKQHVCDPSVVKGDFSYQGETYRYMMAYLGCATTNNTKNEVGIAFAKNPEGPWVKLGDSPIADYYTDFGLSRTDSSANEDIAADKYWGYGQPSLINADQSGKVLLFYTKGTPKGTYTTVELWDMSDADNAVMLKSTDLSEKGITNSGGSTDSINNGDFAYDAATNRLYVVKEDFPYASSSVDGISWITSSNTVFYLQLDENGFDSLFDGSATGWVKVGAITQSLTGYTRNHNCGIVTDCYGQMLNSVQIPIVYTMSLPATDFPDWASAGQWPALHTYRLHGVVLAIE